MTDSPKHDTFAPHVGDPFHAQVEDGDPVTLHLASVDEGADTEHVRSFSLLFEGPEDRELPQGSYAMEHEELGTQHIFIVPIAQEEGGMRYEAVFNHLKESGS